MAMAANRKMNRRMNMLRMPARPGERSASLVSSLTFAAVSHPQKKNTASAAPVAAPPMPPSEPGLNQLPENPVAAGVLPGDDLDDRGHREPEHDEVLDEHQHPLEVGGDAYAPDHHERHQGEPRTPTPAIQYLLAAASEVTCPGKMLLSSCSV